MFSSPAVWVYCIFALGALGVYFLLPKVGRSTKAAGLILALSALIGLILLILNRRAATAPLEIPFFVFSIIAVSCSICVITQTKAVYSALYFVVVVLSVAGLVLLLGAEFLAAALVIIYAGAILVTYVFVIMLASQSGDVLYDRRARGPLGACCAGFILAAAIAGAASGTSADLSTIPGAAQTAAFNSNSQQAVGNTELIGTILMTRYVVVLELAGVLLLLAMVGAIAIARKKFPSRRDDEAGEAKVKIGEAGRTAAPF